MDEPSNPRTYPARPCLAYLVRFPWKHPRSADQSQDGFQTGRVAHNAGERFGRNQLSCAGSAGLCDLGADLGAGCHRFCWVLRCILVGGLATGLRDFTQGHHGFARLYALHDGRSVDRAHQDQSDPSWHSCRACCLGDFLFCPQDLRDPSGSDDRNAPSGYAGPVCQHANRGRATPRRLFAKQLCRRERSTAAICGFHHGCPNRHPLCLWRQMDRCHLPASVLCFAEPDDEHWGHAGVSGAVFRPCRVVVLV